MFALPLRGRAMAGTLHHSQVPAPRSYGIAVLVGYDPGNLVQVRHIMSGPGSEQLRQSNNAQSWVPSAARKISVAKIQGAQFVQVF